MILSFVFLVAGIMSILLSGLSASPALGINPTLVGLFYWSGILYIGVGVALCISSFIKTLHDE
jgi:hypothetical protein